MRYAPFLIVVFLCHETAEAGVGLIVPDYMTGATVGVKADNGTTVINLPWFFRIKNDLWSEIRMSSNGQLNFHFGGFNQAENEPFPIHANPESPSTALSMIAPLWDDWTTASLGSDMYYRIESSRLVATWDVEHNVTGERALFQGVLYSNGVVGFGYDAISSAGDTTRGINYSGHTDGEQFNEAMSFTQRWYTPDGFNYQTSDRIRVEGVPEPSTLFIWSLLGCAAAGGHWLRRRKAI